MSEKKSLINLIKGEMKDLKNKLDHLQDQPQLQQADMVKMQEARISLACLSEILLEYYQS